MKRKKSALSRRSKLVVNDLDGRNTVNINSNTMEIFRSLEENKNYDNKLSFTIKDISF